jgi:hypothetical protein
MLFVSPFFQRIHPEKRGSTNLLHQFAHVHRQIFAVISCMPWFFGSLIPNLGDLNSRLGGCGHESSATYFSNLPEDKDRRFKIKLTLNLILWVNLRLGGYSIWSANLITYHIKKTGQLLGALAPHSLDAARKVLGGHLHDGVWENSKAPSEVLGHCGTRLRRARGIVRPGHTGLPTWHTSPTIRDGTWPTPYICCNYS